MKKPIHILSCLLVSLVLISEINAQNQQVFSRLDSIMEANMFNYRTHSLALNPGEWAWLSFPRLQRTGNDTVAVDRVLNEDIEPNDYNDESQLINIPLGESNILSNTYDEQSDFWHSVQLVDAKSTLGYKLKLLYDEQPEEKWVHLNGSVFSPSTSDDLPDLQGIIPGSSEYYENWLGYYLYAEQSPFDAISQSDLDDIFYIKAQYWACGKLYKDGIPDPYWICECYKGKSVSLKYGDMVVVKTRQPIDDFHWLSYGRLADNRDFREETQNFTFTEQADYTPLFVELDSTQTVLEVGAFVNDSCVGATSVLPDDSLVMVPAYTEGIEGDIYLQTWDGTKSLPPALKKYFVADQETGKETYRSIHTAEKEDYYMISLKKEKKTENPAMQLNSLNLSCSPNPVNEACHISYSISDETYVSLDVFDLYGHKVNCIQQGRQQAGKYRMEFNVKAAKLKSGIYIIRLHAGEQESQGKMVIL